jgi:hypothetical protein
MAAPAEQVHDVADEHGEMVRAFVELLLDSSNTVMQANAITALAGCVEASTAVGLAAYRAGALYAIVTLMRARPGESVVFSRSCSALSLILDSAAGEVAHCWDAAGVEDALRVLLAGMAAHLADDDIQCSACAVVYSLFSCVDASGDVDAGGVADAVFAALRAHADNESVHELGWRALRSVCPFTPLNALRARDGGALDVAVASLQAHAEVSLHIDACIVVLALISADAPDTSAARAAAVSAGAVGAALAAIRVISADSCADIYNDDLFDGAVALLHALVEDAAPAAEAVRAGALEAVLALLPCAETDEHGALACDTLARLTCSEAHAARAVACRAVDACVGVLRWRADGAAEVAISAFRVLANLTPVSPGVAHREGAAPLLRAAMDAHRGHAEMVKSRARMLTWLQFEAVAAADAAAEELLAEEAAVTAAAASKAQRKQAAKVRRAAAAQVAAEAAAAEAAQAAAARMAAQAATEERAAAAAAAAAAADAAAHAARREAAATAAAAAAEQRRQQQRQQRASQPPPLPLPPPPPIDALLQPPPQEGRASNALLEELFPWMRLIDHASPSAPPPALLSGGAGGANDDDDDGDDGCCAICMDAPRTAALVPCGHALLCDACAAKVLATAAPLCPVCRVVATGVRAAPAA